MAWNVFKFCTALRGLGSIMILLVLAVVGVSYYAVVITNYGPGLAAGGLDSLLAVAVLILFHFLFYTFLETSLVGLSLLPDFIAFFSDGEISGTPGTLATSFLAFVLNLAFSLSVLGFLIMHISLVAANTTTIEVFGTDKTYWFIPAYSEEDLRRMPALHGLQYPSKPDLDAQEF
ncbi:UNVERIFIED_CONTAM: putative protein S-acyltransferase 14 [Sesamum calycinum]|uniref:Uncharacterized protein n=1 Tax=Sesamum calycinum TaxID=2727403 RepID=A0AAW2NWC8_9LAMI